LVFGEKTIAGKNVELGRVYDQEQDEEYLKLDGVIRNKNLSDSEKINFFAQNNIKYLVYIKDFEREENLSYNFLNLPKLEKKLGENGIFVYKIQGLDK